MSSTNGSDVETIPPDASNADRSDAAVIGGIIAAIIVVLACLLVVIMRYMYRHKGTYQTNEDKGTEYAETDDDPSLLEDVGDSKKEYFI
ncbi:glycophorin-C-like [Pleurodeles waltl]